MRLARADRWMLSVLMAAGAAMLLYFARRSTTMTIRDPLPWAPPAAAAAVEPDRLVDVNTAGLEELMTLSGIGEVRAQAILDDRAENGPFERPEDLIRVKGIGEGILSGIIDQITTGGGDGAEDFSG